MDKDNLIGKNKLTTLELAVAEHVQDGFSIVLGSALENAIPFAATHELIRQRRSNLNMIAPISDMSTDMLIGAGCVSEVTGAWVGNVSGGMGHNFRRAAEQKLPNPIIINDYSNFSLGMALFAGAHGLPYVPTRSILGSDIIKSNKKIKIAEDPFSGAPIALVPALKPDVAFMVVQRSDRNGNSHTWGSIGLTQEASLAADKIIVIADEIVEPEIISSDPSRVLVPGFVVDAVCHLPAASHPSPLVGRWKRDHNFFHQYHEGTRNLLGFEKWCDEWVRNLPNHRAYREKLGSSLNDLQILGYDPAAIANYAVE